MARPMFGAPYLVYRARTLLAMFGIWVPGVARLAAAGETFGYQCTIPKSALAPTIDSTVLFQSAVSPLPTTPSGQLSGVHSTIPILIDGSTAFIAEMYCSTLVAYAFGLLSAWLSVSQCAP